MCSLRSSISYSKGLVLGNSAVSASTAGDLIIDTENRNDAELRRGVLFWDKLARVRNHVIYMEPTPDELYLESVGMLQVVRGQSWMSGLTGAAYLDAQFNAFEALENLEPGQWAISGGNSAYLDRHHADPDGRSGLVRLFSAIPVPNSSTPLEDLLNFKAKNQAALKDLQLALDDLWSMVVEAKDPAHALQRAIGTIDRCSADVIRAARRSKLQFEITDAEIYTNIDYNTQAAAKGTALGAAFETAIRFYSETGGIELPAVGAVLGVAASGIKFGLRKGITLKARGADPSLRNSPYRYVGALNARPL